MYNKPAKQRLKTHARTPNPGLLGEAFAAQWLQSQGWQIIERRWRCRWGELDLIAQLDQRSSQLPTEDSMLVFIEVKTRSQGNWDADGVFAVTPQKQARLWRAAQYFLSQNPQMANLPCRFDVILVSCQPAQSDLLGDHSALEGPLLTREPIVLGQPVAIAGYQFRLRSHIPSAFGG